MSTTDPRAVHLARSLSSSFAVHVGVRAIEALSIGWLACALVAASAAVTMHSSVSVQAWIAAGLCATCAAASTWLQHPPRRDEHLREADRRLAFDGALVTSAAILPSARTGSLGAALVDRVAARLQGGELWRAALPRTPLALLAALAGAAVLFAAQDASTDAISSSSSGDATITAELESAAQAVRSAALGGRDAGEAGGNKAALTAIANDLERAARSPRVAASETDRLRASIESAQATNPDPSTARALERARSAVESARGATAGIAGGGDLGPRTRGPALSGVERAAATPGDSGAATTPADGSSGSLASAAADGRMSARNAEPRASAGDLATGSMNSASERGVGATRWWPPAYDTIVESWLAPDAPRH